MKIVAHRGLRKKGIKQNSLDSIREAIKNGINEIELDIQKTRDALIIRHDTKKFGLRIKKMKFNPKKFVKLDDALKLIDKNITIIADVKISGIEEELVKRLKGREVIYFSHIKKVLKKIKKLDKKSKIGIYYLPKANFRALLRRLRFVNHFLKQAEKHSADIIAIPAQFLTKKFYDRAKKEGFKVYVYHLWRTKYIKRAYEMGVDALEIDKVKDLKFIKKLKRKGF